MKIKTLQKEAHRISVKSGFWGKAAMELGVDSSLKEKRNLGELIALIHSELSEALEALRKGYIHVPIKMNIKKPDFEEWKEISFLKGEYLASSFGRIQSTDLKVWNGKIFYKKNGRILKPGLSKAGYYTVACRSKTYKVAWLVAEAFLGSRKGKIVNHKNGDKKCDWITNLEYTTSSGNNLHAIKTGLKKTKKILSLNEQFDIAFRLKNNESSKFIHKNYQKVSLSAIKIMKQRDLEKFTECFEMEIADTFIRLGDLCEYLKIDIDWYIQKKLEYNRKRPYKHNKRF